MGLGKDSVMIIHMGGESCSFLQDYEVLSISQGTYGDKEAALSRFKLNYATLPENIKARLVLENDEVSFLRVPLHFLSY